MDLNGDGKMDILSGCYAAKGVKPMTGYFYVLWGEDGGKFSAPIPLKGEDDKPLLIDEESNVERICTRPTAVDWDGDGDLDLIVGNFKGTFYLFRGEGKGSFANKAEPVMADGAALKISGVHSDPICADIDGDGDLDLLSGSSSGGVQWAENTAGPGKEIALKAFQWLIEPTKISQVWSDDISGGPAGSTRVFADDVNGDGKLDILVGDQVTVNELASGATREDAQRKFDVRSKLQKGTGEERAALMKEYRDLSNSMSKVVKSNRTGHVWLYLGK
ncbi:hypothetical protein Rhal01_00069 [Rubritalea halochordaticola]|uniref:VCBS repeat-containing protein n=1 Tax=Rubritalea halochordaticola TaxID=714537 RepID=A0ABP9UU88_9BACT